jgi:hypothetical protein
MGGGGAAPGGGPAVATAFAPGSGPGPNDCGACAMTWGGGIGGWSDCPGTPVIDAIQFGSSKLSKNPMTRTP